MRGGGGCAAAIAGAVAGAMCAAEPALAGEVVTRWTFNGATGTTDPATGSGTATLVGGTTQNFTAGTTTDKFSEDPAQNRAWSVGSFAPTVSGSGTRGVMFQVAPPAGSGITITWSQRHSASSSKWMRFEYTLDGTNFTSDGIPNGGLLEASAGPDVWMNDRTVDLSKVSGIGGNASFAFRIMAVFAPGMDMYVPTGATASYSPLGTVRFDLVTVSATHLPAPGTASLLGAAALTARGMGRRRR